jgi:hypothetical protein
LRRYANHAIEVTAKGKPEQVTRIYDRLERTEAELRRAVGACPLVDAWSHRAIDEALLDMGQPSSVMADGPRRAAREANEKSSRVASALLVAARQLELTLLAAAGRLDGSRVA